MTNFNTHCREGALRFLHTALVIDDRAEMGSEPGDNEPKVATKAGSSILGKQILANAPIEVEPPKSAKAPPAPAVKAARGSAAKAAQAPAAKAALAPEEQSPDVGNDSADWDLNPGYLDAKALTDAFLGKEIICGVHRSVDLAVKAATRADIVVIDWLLEKKSSAKAKEIVKKILLGDAAEHGRARLVAIYTSEPGRADVAKELFDVLKSEDALKDRLKLSDDCLTICGVDTRITIINKTGTPTAQDVFAVNEKDLPDHLVDEFVKLTDGLLSNFAVSSVAAIRRGAHHVLALFSRDLDGVYVAHRCSIKDPGEAKDLALGMIESELTALIENAGVPETTLDPNVIDTWLDREAGNGRSFANDKTRLPVDLVKELTRLGHKRLADKAGQMQAGRDQPSTSNNISAKNITTIFYDDDVAARTAARTFSRLATFKREAGRLRTSDKFQPMLTMGALLKVRKDLVKGGEEVGCDYLLCMQPVCDAVRLTGPTSFPFQMAIYDEEKFNLIVNEPGAEGYLHLDLKPRNTIILRFDPTAGRETVLAQSDKSGAFFFTDAAGRKFQWMGDIANLKAQGFASDIAASQHRVGGDDLEWLRLGSEAKIKPDKRP